ncbi:MAG: HNH endonuclease [Bacteroidota bacterium]
MKVIENFGTLVSISWNSNHWMAEPSAADLNNSNYDYVKDNNRTHETLNFGHQKYPAESDGSYIAYTPMFNRLPAKEKRDKIQIVFFMSTDYKNGNRKKIVGCYGFPEIGSFDRDASDPIFDNYDWGNIKSQVKHIAYFDNYIEISNETVHELGVLPEDKKISQQGFNYLNSDNVYNLLGLAYAKNKDNQPLGNLIKALIKVGNYHGDITKIADDAKVKENKSANTKNQIAVLEAQMRNATPVVKERISKYIERGAIANKVKKLTGYKCQICEQLGESPYSFKKKNGQYYVETHHVEQVSKLKKGSLGIENLITVCANHHRQLHYGNSFVIKNDSKVFVFEIDGQEIEVQKIKLK